MGHATFYPFRGERPFGTPPPERGPRDPPFWATIPHARARPPAPRRPVPERRPRPRVYDRAGGAAFTMDEFRPAKPNGMAVLFVVSGGWFSDHKDVNPLLAKPFNDRGITLFQVVPGSQPRYKIPEMEAMVSRAVRYVRANAVRLGVSPTRIGVTGMSSGGQLALMTGALANLGKPDAPDPRRSGLQPSGRDRRLRPADRHGRLRRAGAGCPGTRPGTRCSCPPSPPRPPTRRALAKAAKELSPDHLRHPRVPAHPPRPRGQGRSRAPGAVAGHGRRAREGGRRAPARRDPPARATTRASSWAARGAMFEWFEKTLK